MNAEAKRPEVYAAIDRLVAFAESTGVTFLDALDLVGTVALYLEGVWRPEPAARDLAWVHRLLVRLEPDADTMEGVWLGVLEGMA